MDEVGGPLTCSKCGFVLKVGRMGMCPQCGGRMQGSAPPGLLPVPPPVEPKASSAPAFIPSPRPLPSEAIYSVLPTAPLPPDSAEGKALPAELPVTKGSRLPRVDVLSRMQVEEEQAHAAEIKWKWQFYGGILGAWLAAIPGAGLSASLVSGHLSLMTLIGAVFGGMLGPIVGAVVAGAIELRARLWLRDGEFGGLVKIGLVLGGVIGPAVLAGLAAQGHGGDFFWIIAGTFGAATGGVGLGSYVATQLHRRTAD